MDMILLDWTRMGKTYCLAGAVRDRANYRIVRPLLAKNRNLPVRNVGWSPWQLDGHTRWEIFELIAPESAVPEPPHLEDLWVRAMRSRRILASAEERRAILTATIVKPNELIFGVPLVATRAAAYLQPGSGQRSLATLVLPSNRLTFTGSCRQGAGDNDIRVSIPLFDLGERWLPVKDHHLLAKTTRAANRLDGQIRSLSDAVQQMGQQIAVRVGLSRPFQAAADRGTALCWLMADGFFSLSEPQP